MEKHPRQRLRYRQNAKKKGYSLGLLLVYGCLSFLFVLVTSPAIANHAHPPGSMICAASESVVGSNCRENPGASELLHLPVGAIASVPEPSASNGNLQRARELYRSGRLFDAAMLWEQTAREYEAIGDRFNHALTLNYLSFAYQDLGEWEKAASRVQSSLNILENQDNLDKRGMAILGQALNTQGSLQLAMGDAQTALETWKQAQSAYDRADNEIGQLGTQINQATALQSLGQYRQAKSLLESLVVQLETQPDSLLKADGLANLGIALQTIGDIRRSKAILEQSWEIVQDFHARDKIGVILLSIGNIARDLDKPNIALAYYREAAKNAGDTLFEVQAKLNELSLLVETDTLPEAIALIPEIQGDLSRLVPSRAAVYARVNFVHSAMGLESKTTGLQLHELPQWSATVAADILASAVQEARDLRDRRAEAAALWQLGKLYSSEEQWQEAKQLTQQALAMAQSANAEDIVARASWQLGRILQQQGNTTEAIAAYGHAFDTLQSLRNDLVAINPEVQFNFSESVEPIYREYVSLLLQPNASQGNLRQAREVMEALQLEELDNFFRDACIKVKPAAIDEIDPQAAGIYPIILRDRLEVILSIPNQPLRHYTTILPRPELEKILENLYSSLYIGYSSNERIQLSQHVYDWLIGPAESDLEANQIKTLVFVLDGFLRNLPMAALHDGERYLIEKYSIALSPGLQLFPEGLEGKELQVLAGGLTVARQGFSSLPGVQAEVKQIAAIASEGFIDAEVMLDGQFTRTALEKQMDRHRFRVVHLATHGQFSSNPEETFLLTWDDRIDVKEFAQLLENRQQGSLRPIDLLVLSACQTAAGDERATLGIAGFALRSGARSTLATLWSVSDRSTALLMSEFYARLARSGGGVSKAEALRQAQIKLLHDSSYNLPYYWAPFVLVGNWL
ncbi:CHAT domain-containing protein [Phormidium sp. CCY1219]|uniref:CHAT domain-containing protein n=1 Tax=Phormidium sp. CCY1219 TaxID=2886104 RepID=UPI002D1E6931|nr:CHAT domain-containing protein [Phormidium sp. CCY1219]MEB3827572.1 CHAT domain-containing protein [Phormidium sp. CCY1219]